MDHRLFAILAIVCFALGGAGCASESQIANREQILMPLQTGSVFQRRVMVEKEGATTKPKEKKKKKEAKEKKEEKEKKEPTESKPASPKPTPAAKPAPTPDPSPQAEPESTPDRFR